MKSKLRNLDTVHAERDELIQQLDTAKQELFHEQKKARERIEELKEVCLFIFTLYQTIKF